ncbi:MAG: transglutaminaseTgpA domain-containing protein [Ardenticatenia bacterium]|nr:transglutaminaseTgpA domain-containing protein [Ardenticatenia bacterium]
MTVVWSLQAAEWTEDLDMLTWVVVVAVPVGLLLAKSRLPGSIAHPLAALVGLVWIARLGFRFTPETAGWQERLILLGERIVAWMETIVAGGASADTAIFVLQMAVLLWFIAYTGTWYLFRAYNPWSALIPAGTTILINTYYTSANVTGFLVLFLIFSYLLVVRTHLFEREEEWQRAGIVYAPDITIDFLRDGVVFALAVILLAWATPSLAEEARSNPLFAYLGRPWAEVQRTWARLFGTLNYQGGRGSGPGSGWFGRSMTLRGPLNLSEEVVMYVYTSKGRYWRTVVFDTYTGAGWTTTDTRLVTVDENPASLPLIENVAGRERITVTVEMIRPVGSLLFAPAEPVQVSMPVNVLLAGPASNSGPLAETPETAVAQLYAQEPLIPGDRYEVVSALAVVDEASLRQAGTDYPDYIATHYTQLPPSLPQEVIDLSKELTAGLETPYDKAKAIEQYLRDIRYDEEIPGPRPGEDGVYYFLFRERAGYCDYYASAMAVMLRAVGVPTRIAQGYALGDYDPAKEVYEVRGVNAHTWVEVYFPGYGWIEFEPTASQPPLERPAGASQKEEEDETAARSDEEEPNPLDRLQDLQEALDPELPTLPARPRARGVPTGVLFVPVGAALGSVLVVSAGAMLMRRRWREVSSVERAYDQLVFLGRLLGEQPSPSQTPWEYLQHVASRVPRVRRALERLALLVSTARFAPWRLTEEDERRALALWDEARRPLTARALRQVPRRFVSLLRHAAGRARHRFTS